MTCNRINLRKHDEEVDLCADLAIDESIATYKTPLQVIVNAPGMYLNLFE